MDKKTKHALVKRHALETKIPKIDSMHKNKLYHESLALASSTPRLPITLTNRPYYTY